MEKNPFTFYYSTPESKETKAARDFCDRVFRRFAELATSKPTRDFISNSRTPSERELYGLFIRAIVEGCEKEFLGHIGTELKSYRKPQEQSDQNQKIQNRRPDILVNYRNASFIIELKTERVSATAKNGDEPARITSPWIDACEQAKSIDISTFEDATCENIIHIPVVIYFYGIKVAQEQPPEDHLEQAAFAHERINRILESQDPPAQYELRAVFDEPVLTRFRASSTDISDRWIFGLSLFARAASRR